MATHQYRGNFVADPSPFPRAILDLRSAFGRGRNKPNGALETRNCLDRYEIAIYPQSIKKANNNTIVTPCSRLNFRSGANPAQFGGL
jgi:hypothetical protein